MRAPLDSERVPPATFAWLERQADRWRSAGLIDDTAATEILAAYQPEASRGRGTLALIVLAALMVGIGVLLLIGYNWDRLGPLVKVALTMTAVASAFAASAVAFVRRRPVVGETLALIGTFAFANSIWLIAQVLHIPGHYPDGFMWSAVGALAASFVLRSTWIGIEAAIFSLLWVAAAAVAPPHAPALPFLAFAPVAIAAAYHAQSPVMLRVAAFAVALWLFLLDPDSLDDSVVFFGAAAITGCAFFAVGLLHATNAAMRRAWQSAGLTVLVVLFPAFLTADFHRWSRAGDWENAPFAVAVIGTILTGALTIQRRRDAGARAVAAVACAVLVWVLFLISGVKGPQHLWVVIFSALALLLAISLTQDALRTADAPALAFAILFGLEFTVVRWASVVENMLWSGVMLLTAGGGLLLVARLWRHRDRHAVLSGGKP